MTDDYLFTYGTLGPGQDYEHLLGPGRWKNGYIHARHLPDDWDNGAGYPGIVLSETDIVKGHLFISENLSERWPEIDAYEGPLYRRIRVPVHLENDETILAYVYEAKP